MFSKDPFLPKGRDPKINFGTPIVFEIYVSKASLEMPDHI